MNTSPVCQHLALTIQFDNTKEELFDVLLELRKKQVFPAFSRESIQTLRLVEQPAAKWSLGLMTPIGIISNKCMNMLCFLYCLLFFEHKKGAIKCQDFIQLICRVQQELQSPQFGDFESGA